MSFPIRTQQQRNEEESFSLIQIAFKDLGVFRDQTIRDYGIDFEIEIENDGRMEGHCLKVQVKSSNDLNIRSDGHAIVGGIKQTTLNYWAEISFNLPVVGIVVNLDSTKNIYVSGLLFWQVVSLIEPSGDEVKKEADGHIIKTPTKTIDFGNCCDNYKNMEKLRKYAYGYSLRDFLNAHKWILTNIKEIFQMYNDASTCDQWMPIFEPKMFKMFLQQAKAFVYYDLGYREIGENLDVVFNYQYYINKSNGDEPYNIEVAPRLPHEKKIPIGPVLFTASCWFLPAIFTVFFNKHMTDKKLSTIYTSY